MKEYIKIFKFKNLGIKNNGNYILVLNKYKISINIEIIYFKCNLYFK